MDKQDIERLLSDAGLRPSPVRVLIIGLMDKNHYPVSSLEIETRLETVDRSSISRSLALFAKNGIVHVVDDGSGSLKYELCRSTDSHGHDDDNHPHFHCVECGTTVCLDEDSVPSVRVPDGYVAESVNYVIRGLCPTCARLRKSRNETD